MFTFQLWFVFSYSHAANTPRARQGLGLRVHTLSLRAGGACSSVDLDLTNRARIVSARSDRAGAPAGIP
jgi:hypothetical protein